MVDDTLLKAYVLAAVKDKRPIVAYATGLANKMETILKANGGRGADLQLRLPVRDRAPPTAT
jgi:hypothetical protein